MYLRLKGKNKATLKSINLGKPSSNRAIAAAALSLTSTTTSNNSKGASDTTSNTSRPTLFNLEDYLTALRNALNNNIIEMFNYIDSITEFSPIVGVRSYYTNNLRFSRFIINVGIENFIYYKIVRSSKLYSSSAEALLESRDTDIVFDLCKRKR